MNLKVELMKKYYINKFLIFINFKLMEIKRLESKIYNFIFKAPLNLFLVKKYFHTATYW